MPVCGSCGKSVASSDIICPHCGVLLAAYASPAGSTEFSTEIDTTAPSAAKIPSVDLHIPPPTETTVTTDPNEVAEEAISTAPRPLFDTYLTVEDLAKAAEDDHTDEVVTLTHQNVPAKTVEFAVPSYARPPADAAPLPTIDGIDPALPVMTQTPVEKPQPTSRAKTQPTPEPESDSSGESWLYDQPVAKPKRKSPRPDKAKPAKAKPTSDAGQTEDYLRRLHTQAGYDASKEVLSQPVPGTDDRPAPAQRGRHDQSVMEQRAARESAASSRSIRMGCLGFYGMIVFIMWSATIITIITGQFSGYLLLSTLLLTWGFRQVRLIIDRISQQ